MIMERGNTVLNLVTEEQVDGEVNIEPPLEGIGMQEAIQNMRIQVERHMAVTI